MKQITRDEALKFGLPKWPQCLITGPAVTPEQAKDIILRTDYFITAMSPFAGGNNREWNDWAIRELGYDLLQTELSGEPSQERAAWLRKSWEVADKAREQLGMLSPHYLTNSWASCAFIYGPHGWCHPNGRIFFNDNVGKWPSVEEVAEDVEQLGQAFPYLELWLTLMNGESCEMSSPVVTMRLKDQQVTFYEGTLEPFSNEPHQRTSAEMSAAVASIAFGHRRREQGLPDDWIVELGKVTKPLIERLLREQS